MDALLSTKAATSSESVLLFLELQENRMRNGRKRYLII
jgi:hypothetical protein